MYQFGNLGVFPGGSSSVASAINSHGHVAGWADLPTSESHAFIWKPGGGLIDLGTLGGRESAAFDINDSDQVVGYSYVAQGGYPGYHAFIWDQANGMRDLGTIGGYSWAFGIGHDGTVVGSSGGNAFRWDPTNGMQDLGSVSDAFAINAAGTICGASKRHAVLWTPSLGLIDLGTFPDGSSAQAIDINNSGHIVARSQTLDAYRTFFWSANTGMEVLNQAGSVGIEAFAINDSDEIVGCLDYWAGPRAFARRFGWISDLNNLLPNGSGWYLQWCSDVNASGQIVGYGTHNGAARGFVATPTWSPGKKMVAQVVWIIMGVVSGGGGVVWPFTGGGPVPVPGPTPWKSATSRDVARYAMSLNNASLRESAVTTDTGQLLDEVIEELNSIRNDLR